MDIQLTTGEKLFDFPTDVGHAFICLRLATKLEKPRPAPPSPTWTYCCALTPGGAYAVQRKRGYGEVEYFQSSFPDKVRDGWPDCPQDVLDQFAATRPDSRVGTTGGLRY